MTNLIDEWFDLTHESGSLEDYAMFAGVLGGRYDKEMLPIGLTLGQVGNFFDKAIRCSGVNFDENDVRRFYELDSAEMTEQDKLSEVFVGAFERGRKC